MSINVQTSNGLKKISGENITSRKVLSAIGYVPAQASMVETHVNNKGIHITDSERAAWNAKSDFSGDYNHLTGAPNITEDESAILYIADKSGNIIAQIDKDGVYTTDVILSRDKKSVLNAINKLETLSYNDLKDRPDVLDDGSDNFLIVDPLGNIILKVDANGLYSTNAFIDGVDLSSKINEFNVHILNKEIHITQVEREAWNAKSNFDGDYNSLTNKPNVLENDLQSFNITDKDGNVLFKVDKDAAYTNKLMINEKDVESALNALEVSIEKNKDDIELDGQNIESLKSRLDTLEPIVEAHTKSFVEDESGVLNIVDPAGKIALQIDKDATRVDNLEANNLKIGTMDIASEITKVETDLLNNYYTKTETNNNFDKINSANNAEKAAKEYADKQVSDLEEALKGNVSSDYNTLEKIEDEIGKTNTAIDTESKRAIDAEEELNKKISTNITNIGTNASKIEENKNTLNTHINDKIVHITNEERGLWNDASSKATNLEILTQDIRRDENVFAIVNEDGYIGFKVDETGTYANKLYASGNSKDIITQIKDARDFTTESINNVIDKAPGDYDTLNKIANKVSSKAEKEELDKLAANLNSNYYTSATTDEKIASANNAQTEALQKEIKDASDAITNGATADYNTLGKIEAQIKTKANNDTVTTLETLMNNEIDRSTKEDTRLAGLIGTNQNNINTNSSNIQTNKTNLTNHINNKEVHIQSNERENWDNALSKATNLEILTQDMQRDEKVFAILDKYNKVGFKVDEYGIAYTAKLVVDGEDIVEKIDNVQEEAIKHADDRIRDLIGGADEAYDTLKEIQKEIQENEGNISSFLAALDTRASATDFENHKNNKNNEQHVTKDQITSWDSKAPGDHVNVTATDKILGHVKLSDSTADSKSDVNSGIAATPYYVHKAIEKKPHLYIGENISETASLPINADTLGGLTKDQIIAEAKGESSNSGMVSYTKGTTAQSPDKVILKDNSTGMHIYPETNIASIVDGGSLFKWVVQSTAPTGAFGIIWLEGNGSNGTKHNIKFWNGVAWEAINTWQ